MESLILKKERAGLEWLMIQKGKVVMIDYQVLEGAYLWPFAFLECLPRMLC